MKQLGFLATVGIMWATSLAFAQDGTPPQDTAAADTGRSVAAAPTIAPPAPVANLVAKDSPNDHGHSVTLTWDRSPDDGGGAGTVAAYEVLRWSPALLDSLHATQSEIDRLNSLHGNFKDFLPLARKLAKRYESRGQADSAKVLRDSVATMERMMQELPARLTAVQTKLKGLWAQIPEAHRNYPNNGMWQAIGDPVPAGTTRYVNVGSKEKTDSSYLPDHVDYYYRVDAITLDTTVRTPSAVSGPVQSSGQWYNLGRTPALFAVLLFGLATVLFVRLARSGKNLYVRPLGGIEAIDEAIGRATEMGKPILYVLGLGTAADIATIASLTILGRVAKRVAEYQTDLIVPTYDPIVLSVAQETVKAAYGDAGRPDSYKDDAVFFVTQNQFAYVSAINGIMLRQHPATNVYMGKFYAESLILAETGALAGSIQISGTDEVAQIPFFVVACDYTLIGEELYAASAYLGREPILLGSLKAQDYAKAVIVIIALIGVILINAIPNWGELFKTLFKVAN